MDMETHSLPEALKAIMERHRWTQTDLARELGVSQVWVSEASRGKKDTGIANAARRLARVGWEVVIRPKREDPVKRREFNAKVAQSAAGVILIPSAPTDSFQDAQYVSALADRAATMFHELGGIPVANLLVSQVRRTGKAIYGSDRKLQAAAARLAREATKALYDAQRYNEAQRVGEFSLTLARHAQDFPAQAGSYTILSQMNTTQKISGRAVMYAEQALRLPDLTPANQAYIKVRLGRALSLIPGQERHARSMLDQALDQDNVPAFEAVDVSANVAIALDHLRLHNDALSAFDKAVTHMGRWSSLYKAHYLAHQTNAALHARDLSLSADLMSTLARVVPMLSSERLHDQVGEIIAASAPWADVREVRDARQQLRAAVPREQAKA